MFENLKDQIDSAKRIIIIQPENPDADSLGSSLALEDILSEIGKEVTLFCAIDMPKYLRYISGWDRVLSDWNGQYDLAIVVDTATDTLLTKALLKPGVRHFLETKPVLVLDHHNDERDDETDQSSLSFPHELILDDQAAATGELIFQISKQLSLTISKSSADTLLASILGDTLGLSTPSLSIRTMETVVELMKLGAHPAEIELKRREFMKKPADILSYKADLIKRIEYHCDGRLALVHIPWEDIAQYSDRYNPSVLVLDEMRLVEGVDVAIAIKTYPDNKLTGKIRSNLPVADQIAGFFGGGGHSYSAGYKIYENYDTAIKELVGSVDKILEEFDNL